MKYLILILSLLGGLGFIYYKRTHSNAYVLNQAIAHIKKLHEHNAKIIKRSLKGGSDASLYKVTCADQNYVVRLINHRNMRDRDRELHAQQIASDQKYGPHVYKADLNVGWVVMGFIEDKKQKLSVDQKIKGIAELLRKIHTGPKFKQHIPIADQIKLHWAKVKNFPKDIAEDKLQSVFEEIKNTKTIKITPCHQDFTRQNVLYDGDFKAIDFENAAQGDPFFDLASATMFYRFSEQQTQQFLKAYFGREPSDQENTHFKVIKRAVYLFFGLIILNMVSEKLRMHEVKVIHPNQYYDSIVHDKVDYDDPLVKLTWAVSMLNQAIYFQQ